jgi:hypothetical protein
VVGFAFRAIVGWLAREGRIFEPLLTSDCWQASEEGPDLRAGRSNEADSLGKEAILGGQLGDLPLPSTVGYESTTESKAHEKDP